MNPLPHTVVSASAGTGKTFALTNRLVKLLHLGAPPSSILATTFTRKAAGEILERVLKRLADAASGGKALEQVGVVVGAEIGREAWRDLLVSVTGKLNRLSVLTLDAFFMRMARCFALELGAPPGWSILSEEELAAAKAEAIEAVLEVADTEEKLEAVRSLVRAIEGEKASSRVWNAFEREVDRAYGAYLASRGKPEAWEEVGPTMAPLGAAEVAGLIIALKGAELPRTQKGERNLQWVKGVANLIGYAEGGAWADVLEHRLVENVAKQEERYNRVPIPEEIRSIVDSLGQHAAAVRLDEARRHNIGVRDLMAEFDREYRRAKLGRGGMSFDDVPRLLLERPRLEETHDLYYRLDASLRHLLLDEFQDTSVVQFNVLRPIFDELASRGDGMSSVFCVGDVKQSLYLWRDAEPRLLPTISEQYPQFKEERLDESWRSSRVILETVNTVFGGLGSNAAAQGEPAAAGFGAVFPEHVEGIDPERGARPGEVEMLEARATRAAEDDDDEESTEDEDWISYIAERAAQLGTRAPGASIAVLVRENRPIARIIHELNRRGMRASQEGGAALLDSPAVVAAVSALHLADHPADGAARLHVGTSPLGPVVGLGPEADERDAELFSQRLRERLMREGYAAVLGSWQRKVAAEVDARGLARLDQLIELAQEEDARGVARPGEFVRAARQRRVEDAGEHPIRVLTIHRSKGLEFDAVVLPLKERGWKLGAGDMLVERPNSMGPWEAVSLYLPEVLEPYSERLKGLRTESRGRAILEELCCLYVGMTRARHSLTMIVPPVKINASGAPRELSLCAPDLVRAALLGSDAFASREVLWRAATEQGWEEKFAREEAKAERTVVELRVGVAKGERPPAHRLARQSPSSLEGGERVELASLLSPAPSAGRERGTLLHAFFETVEWLDDGEPGDETLRAAAAGLEASEAEVEAAIAEFRRVLAGPIGALLRRSEYAGRAERLLVWREHPFAVRDDEGERILSGQFDRVVLGLAGGKVVWGEVLDFKTDAVRTKGEIEERAGHYAPQARAYGRALGRMFGLEEGAVRARLMFTGVGEWVG